MSEIKGEGTKQVMLINESHAALVAKEVNDALKVLLVDHNIEEIVYRPVATSMGGYNCIMIVYTLKERRHKDD